MIDVDLRNADLRGTDLSEAELDADNLGGTYRSRTSLRGARLAGSNLASANLEGADLRNTQFVGVDLTYARLNRAHVYGISTWDVKLDDTQQRDLRITRDDQAYLAVDQVELAQFVYLLIENSKLRDVLEVISSKTVLILGRFTKERMEYIDIVRDQIRKQHMIPMVFDFTTPAAKDLTGTVEVLARLAKFVVADLSDPSSVPHELATTVPFLRRTPILPLLDTRSHTYGMFSDIASYPWVLDLHEYDCAERLKQLLPGALKAAGEIANTLSRSD